LSQYLLDTNIWIYYLKGLFNLNDKIGVIGIHNLGISEISIAELKFGAYNSEKITENLKVIDQLIEQVNVYQILPCLDVYAKEKTRLRKIGNIVDEFDLLIGATAIHNNLILVTRNLKHFERLESIETENWVK